MVDRQCLLRRVCDDPRRPPRRGQSRCRKLSDCGVSIFPTIGILLPTSARWVYPSRKPSSSRTHRDFAFTQPILRTFSPHDGFRIRSTHPTLPHADKIAHVRSKPCVIGLPSSSPLCSSPLSRQPAASARRKMPCRAFRPRRRFNRPAPTILGETLHYPTNGPAHVTAAIVDAAAGRAHRSAQARRPDVLLYS